MIYIKNIFIILTLLLCIPGNIFALDVTAGSNALTVDSAASRGLAAADFNDDGDIDIYVANRSQQNQLWLSDGSGDFVAANIPGDLITDISHEALSGDFNGDGFPDIYVLNIGAQNRLWINDGTGSFTSAAIATDLGSTYGGAIGDIDGDGDIDLYAANLGANRLWRNNGDATFTNADIALDGGNSADAVMVDIDGDDDLDIYVGNYGQNRLWINDGTGSFTGSLIVGDTANSYGVAFADVDGDGDNDLYAANDSGAQNRLWMNDGAGNFTANDIVGDTGTSRKAAFADMDGDDDMDLYVANNGQNRLWINDGTGLFTADNILGDFGDSNAVLLFDFDDDGDNDIFVANSGQQNKLWINNQIVIVDTDPSPSPRTSGVKRICADPTALNYDDTRFGRHTPSWCRYGSAVDSDIPVTNPFGGVLCSEELRIHDNMKQGDVNGIYSSYNKGVVTEVSLLQSHINRLLTDDYSQAAGPVDIWFGSQTKRGVERLQIKLNQLQGDRTPLVIDGIVGTYTKAAINMSC